MEPNWFAPIGVGENRRKSGVGSVLLFESLRLMRLNGITEAFIPWTGNPFFYTQVTGIVGVRHYHIMGSISSVEWRIVGKLNASSQIDMPS